MPHIALKAMKIQVIGEDGKPTIEIRQPGQEVPEAETWKNPGVWVRRGSMTDANGIAWKGGLNTGKRHEATQKPDGAGPIVSDRERLERQRDAGLRLQKEAELQLAELNDPQDPEPSDGAGETGEPSPVDEDGAARGATGGADAPGEDIDESNDEAPPLEEEQDEADTKPGCYTESDLDDLTKPTLIEIGEEFGLALAPKLRKAVMITAIMEAQG